MYKKEEIWKYRWVVGSVKALLDSLDSFGDAWTPDEPMMIAIGGRRYGLKIEKSEWDPAYNWNEQSASEIELGLFHDYEDMKHDSIRVQTHDWTEAKAKFLKELEICIDTCWADKMKEVN